MSDNNSTAKGIIVSFQCQTELNLKDCRIATILYAFAAILPEILAELFQQIVRSYAEYVMTLPKKPFRCKCGNDEDFIWKTRHGKKTLIHAFYCWIRLCQLQVQCKRCGKKMYITRALLGLARYKRIAPCIYRRLALVGVLTTFRAAEKIVNMFGWSLDKMTIWHAVQKVGSGLEFKLDPSQSTHGEADGTGIGIKGIAKRGKELKVFIQYKKSGGVRIAGLDIGNYNGSWDGLFRGSLDAFRQFKEFLLVTDGDSAILDGLKDKVKVIFQRCLWHIPYQAKYVLWQDSVKRKSEEWLHVIAELMEICAIRPLVESQSVIASMLESKNKRLQDLIEYCRKRKYKHAVSYLENAQPDMFSAIAKRLNGKTTSRVERVMRTVNMRMNVSKWTKAGALNAVKVRLAYYYNDFDPG